MKVLKKFLLLGFLFCTITLGALSLLTLPASAKDAAAVAPISAASAPVVSPPGKVNPTRTNAGPQSNAVSDPKDVIELSKLVIEVTRDQTSNLARYIEYSTTVIVVFFSLLGAVGAAFGWYKLNDMEATAAAAMANFQKDLDAFKTKAQDMQGDFKASIDSATADLHREINDQIELIAARAEIDQAINGKFEPAQGNRMLANASKRIQVVLDSHQVSIKARIRGMADLAFALKRLGDHEKAFQTVTDAADSAQSLEPKMFPLLAYNAACYATLLDKPDSCEWLSKAIAANAQYKEAAKKDVDFEKIRETSRFKELTA